MKVKLCDWIGHRYKYDLTEEPILRCCVRCGVNHARTVVSVTKAKNGKPVPVFKWEEAK